jgi:hypothetical protein
MIRIRPLYDRTIRPPHDPEEKIRFRDEAFCSAVDEGYKFFCVKLTATSISAHFIARSWSDAGYVVDEEDEPIFSPDGEPVYYGYAEELDWFNSEHLQAISDMAD